MMRAACLTAVLLAAAAAVLPAQNRDFGRADWCDDAADGGRNRVTECRVLEETLTGMDTLDVDAGRNGGIRVRGWDSADTAIRARVTAWARSAADARGIVDQVRLDTSGGRIRAVGPDDGNWSTSFELQVPRDARLTLKASNGGLVLTEFGGRANMETVNGGIVLTDVGGDITGRTSNGGINVSLTGSRWEGRGLDVETHNGGVSMTLPDGYSAELETATVNGGLRIDFPITVQGTLNRQITTRLGAGGARIRAVTTNGGVSIRRR